jgi:hypothetical protein
VKRATSQARHSPCRPAQRRTRGASDSGALTRPARAAAAGQKLHQHSGANKAKMEAVMQQLISPEEDPSFGNVFKRQVWHAKLGLV